MTERRRAGKRIRGGAGRSLLARLRPDARARLLRREVGTPAPKAKPRTLHEVTLHGLVAQCSTCDWRGAADEFVAHVFGRATA
jgi:hypothetical protein